MGTNGNKNYVNGRAKEYRIGNKLKALGFDIVQRTAGSHSPIDVFAIHKEERIIQFVQSKPKNFSQSAGQKILDELDYLNGQWTAEFILE